MKTPSNLAMLKMGARRWIARIMFTWGHLSGAIAFVWNWPSFDIIRFLFGAAEADFFRAFCNTLTLYFLLPIAPACQHVHGHNPGVPP